MYRYNLYAVIAHIGEIMSGHYVTFIKFKYQGSEHWIMYDKTRQCQVFEDQVLETEGIY